MPAAGADAAFSILLATPWYPSPERPIFGVFCQQNAEALRRAGHTVRVLQVWHDPGAVSTPGVARARYPATSRGALALGAGRAMLALRAAIDSAPIDLIHAHVLFPVGFAAAVVGRARRVPVVLTEHLGPFATQVRTPLRRMLARWTLANVSAVVPVSRALAGQMGPYLAPSVPLRVVPNTVDAELFARDLRPRPGHDRIVFVGRLAPEKRVEDAIAALALLRSRRPAAGLRLVGDGPERARLEAQVRELGLEDAVSFAGLVDHPTVAGEIANADAAVLPSARENNPCALLEALVAGRPVVSTVWEGAEEIVAPEVGALAPIGDPAGLAEALDEVLARRTDERAISAYAVGRWSHAALARELGALYRRSLEAPRR